MAGGNDSWSGKFLGGGPREQMPFGGRPQSVPIYTPPTLDAPRVNGRWALYDEKWITYPGLDKNRYDSKSPQSWLQATRDYVAGRTSEIDPLLDWVERQVEPITTEMHVRRDDIPMVDSAGNLVEVSRQFWAMLNSLLASDSHQAGMFANVQRHYASEAGGLTASPVNEEKQHVRSDLSAIVTNPKGATSMDGIAAAVQAWNTNIRLFVAADGEAPTESAKRMTLIHMLPIDVSAYISMHEAREEFRSFDALKRFVYKYVRTLRSLKRTGPRAAHLLDDAPPPLEVEEEDEDEEALMQRLLATDDVEEQVEILAFMKQSGFRPPTRGQGGPRRFVPRTGDRGAPARTGPAARFGAPPPRSRRRTALENYFSYRLSLSSPSPGPPKDPWVA